MKKFAVLVGLLMVMTVVLTACGGGGGGGAAQTVTIKGEDSFAFTPATVPVKAGKVTVVLDNTGGTQVHDLTISSLNVQIIAQPGQKAEGTFDAKEGTIDFHCSQPGHEAGGMVGKFEVTK